VTGNNGIAFSLLKRDNLVLATFHANSANHALDRIINFFLTSAASQLLIDRSLNSRALNFPAVDSPRVPAPGESRQWKSGSTRR